MGPEGNHPDGTVIDMPRGSKYPIVKVSGQSPKPLKVWFLEPQILGTWKLWDRGLIKKPVVMRRALPRDTVILVNSEPETS